MQDIFTIYEKKSRQILNKEKSSLLFSPHVRSNDKELVIQAIGGTICGSYEKYLGLPALVGRSKYNIFKNIKEKVWKRITS